MPTIRTDNEETPTFGAVGCAVEGCKQAACQIIRGARFGPQGTDYMFLLCGKHTMQMLTISMQFLAGVPVNYRPEQREGGV
jgi:hypothetical protein